MKPATFHKSLGLGDHVKWANPDNGATVADYEIIEILTEDGKVDDMDSVVIIKDPAGNVEEVFVAELH